MPIEDREKAESIDRYLYFLTYLLSIAFTFGLTRWANLRMAQVGLQMTRWSRDMAIGVLIGGSLLMLQGLLNKGLTGSMRPPTTDRFKRRSVGLWIAVFTVGACAEEFWIAVCLVTMAGTGHVPAISVAATAVVFGVVHMGYGAYGAFSVAMRAVISCLIFIWLGSIIAMALFHLIGDLGNLYWLRRG